MPKKKKARDKRWSVDNKYCGARLKSCDGTMDAIKKQIGKGGDYQNDQITLIGSVEYLNHEAQDGQTLMNAYNNFNKVTLKNIRKELAKIDELLQYLDRVAK